MIIPVMGNSPGNSWGFLQAIVATRWGESEILKECWSNFLFIWITLVLQEEKGRHKYLTTYQAFKSTVLTFIFITVILINAASQKLERKLLLMSTKAKAAASLWCSCRFNMQIRPQWAAPTSVQHTRTIILPKESDAKSISDVGSSSSVQQSSCCLQTSHISRKCGRIPFSINIYLFEWNESESEHYNAQHWMFDMWCESAFWWWVEFGVSSCVSLFRQRPCNWGTVAADEIPSKSPPGNCLLTLPVCNWVLSLILTGSSCEVTPFN